MNHRIKTHDDLDVYQLAFKAAMKIFELAKKFPAEERYSLTDNKVFNPAGRPLSSLFAFAGKPCPPEADCRDIQPSPKVMLRQEGGLASAQFRFDSPPAKAH